jgi:hypothetical protein
VHSPGKHFKAGAHPRKRIRSDPEVATRYVSVWGSWPAATVNCLALQMNGDAPLPEWSLDAPLVRDAIDCGASQIASHGIFRANIQWLTHRLDQVAL